MLEDILDEMQSELGDLEFAKIRLPAGKRFQQLTQVERSLARFVCERLAISDTPQLRERAPEGTWKEIEQRIARERQTNPKFSVQEALELNHIKAIIERRDNQPDLLPTLTNPERDGFHNLQEVLNAVDALATARRSVAHGHRARNRPLDKEYLATFERVL